MRRELIGGTPKDLESFLNTIAVRILSLTTPNDVAKTGMKQQTIKDLEAKLEEAKKEWGEEIINHPKYKEVENTLKKLKEGPTLGLGRNLNSSGGKRKTKRKHSSKKRKHLSKKRKNRSKKRKH